MQMRKQMEGDSRARRTEAREARERGGQPSADDATTGASKQRHHLKGRESHEEKVETIRKGKQPMISENTPEVRPRSRGGNVWSS
jgi:hypothetical protein